MATEPLPSKQHLYRASDRVAEIRRTIEDMQRHDLLGMIPQDEALFLLAEIERLQRQLNEEIQHRDALWNERDQLRDNLAHVVGRVSNGLPVETAEAQDAARYRWLRSHIAPTIIKRINAEQIDQRPEALDAVIDCRMERAAEKSSQATSTPAGGAQAAPGGELPPGRINLELQDLGPAKTAPGGGENCEHGIPRRFCTAAHMRKCEFCGCETNAEQRFCCEAARDADRARVNGEAGT